MSGRDGRALPSLQAKDVDLLRMAGVRTISCTDTCETNRDFSEICASLPAHSDAALLKNWRKQEVDCEQRMLGQTKAYLRQCLISTGKRDWPHDIASVDDSLALALSLCINHWKPEADKTDVPADEAQTSVPILPEGCWQTRNRSMASTKINVLNGSNFSSSSSEAAHDIMLLPDWQLIANVPAPHRSQQPQRLDKELLKAAFDAYIAPDAPRLGATEEVAKLNTASGIPPIRRLVLPYNAVILLCSHKKRDVRCHLAAPLLAEAFRAYAEGDGWDVDERGDFADSCLSATSPMARDADGLVKGCGWGVVEEAADVTAQLQGWKKRAAESKQLGMFYTSHIGGHKFAGNVIIQWPNGSCIWYGRVDPLNPSHIASIFEQTVKKGVIIEEFLRAAINVNDARAGDQMLW